MTKTKPSGNHERRVRFKAAIALADTTVSEWCEQNEVTTGHLDKVLRGTRESPPLVEKIDAFIERHMSAHAA